MPFTQIVYESLASDKLTEADVLDILRLSQTRNNQAGVSGILLFRGRRFLQFLEGPKAEVEALYARIERDPRHRELRILSHTNGEQLLMPTWAMAYVSPTFERRQEDPFVLGRQQALNVCELLPEEIARPFLDLLNDESEAV
ncbi:BLUF domain-containing protein [uncultured Azonexus sp.]|uniref:BLUF domain-containing protein n=1 Tax=uncultured Azonexus sp. TaxID=520307 RepID=UPI0026118247|nr:BLUF domain-containing protein [uncultured Azonexus sp.]